MIVTFCENKSCFVIYKYMSIYEYMRMFTVIPDFLFFFFFSKFYQIQLETLNIMIVPRICKKINKNVLCFTYKNTKQIACIQT